MIVVALTASGCAGWGGGGVGGGGPDSINVLMVNNPQMVDLQSLTAENFTGGDRDHGELHRPAGERRAGQDQPGVLQPGRSVRRRLAEQLRDPDLRTKRVDRPAGRIHRRGSRSSTRTTSSSRWCSRCPGRTGKVYGQPFYGESSFLMYRKDVAGRRGHHDAGAADLAGGGRHRGPGRRRGAGDGRHLPARASRVGVRCSRR